MGPSHILKELQVRAVTHGNKRDTVANRQPLHTLATFSSDTNALQTLVRTDILVRF